MSFPRYEKYKDSGVEWLGEVPTGWSVWTLRRSLLEHRQGYYSSDPYVDFGVKLLRITDFRGFGTVDFENCPRVENKKEIESFLLRESDFVFARTGGAGTFGLIDNLPEPIAYASYLIRFRFHDTAQPRFLRYFFQSSSFQNAVRQNIHGGVNQNLHAEDIKNQYIALPTDSEQNLISSFLDRETGKIDALVAEQRRLIELLKEKRQAIISHAVTKGLDPKAPMKDSGIEWLGEVPEHWEVMPMRMIANVVRGASPRPAGDPRYFGGDEMPWVTVAEITKDDAIYLTETETFLTQEGAMYSNLFRSGTLIYSNSGATLGVPKILRIDACANDGVVAFLNLSNKVRSEFLYYYLTSIMDCIREKVKQGSGQPNLNTDIVKSLRFGLPPLKEQHLIVRRIAELAEEFRALTTEAQRAIDLLQERRTALISAAVTGKIDVRNLAKTEAA